MIPKVDVVHAQDVTYILFDTHDYITQKIKVDGSFEAGILIESTQLLKDQVDGCVLDIGANLGSYTIPLAKSHPHLEFYSFEPQRHIYYQLCGNVVLNSLSNVRVFNAALGSKKDTVKIYPPNYLKCDNIGGFRLRSAINNDGTEVVEVSTIDSMALSNVRLIKIDVEGMELDVLIGATQTIIDNNHPPILFEAWGADWYDKERDELFRYVNNLGYDIRHFGENHIATKRK